MEELGDLAWSGAWQTSAWIKKFTGSHPSFCYVLFGQALADLLRKDLVVSALTSALTRGPHAVCERFAGDLLGDRDQTLHLKGETKRFASNGNLIAMFEIDNSPNE